ncbi:MAG: ABC transporter ATP-binding protein [Spirochaetota bacterium]
MSLELKNVVKHYPEFIMELSFRVETGKLLTLLGPSGCGKTTTLHLIAGFIMPDSGRIEIDGKDVTAIPPHLRRVGVVFQDYALFPNMNVYNNIAFGLRMQEWDRPAIRKRVKELLELVRLEGFEKRTVTQLSGGEQQRVALARALAPNPRLLLLDEPLSALDANLRKELRGEIKRIQRELKITTVYVTHDQEEALAISDMIVLMHDGRIEQTGIPPDIYNCPETLFGANFMGMTNRIRGIVKQKTERYVELDTKEGKFYATFKNKINAGSSVLLLFRPEHCRVIQIEGEIERAAEIDKTELSPNNLSGLIQTGKKKIKTKGFQSVLRRSVANSITGTVTRCEYLGERTLIQIETEHGRYGALLPCPSYPDQTPTGSIPDIPGITSDSRPGITNNFEAKRNLKIQVETLSESRAQGSEPVSKFEVAPSPVKISGETLRVGTRVTVKINPEDCWILLSR